MTDQPKTLLAQLAENCTIAAPTIRRRQQSKDGTVKYLLQLADGNCIETVLMRYKYGNTVCVSTQVGCAMAAASAPLPRGRPRAGFDRGRDCLRNLHRTEGLRRAGLSHRFNGHR